MVGVPGRSKSCGTCRIRKKGGCDMKRPSCTQCLTRGLKCDGYERKTVFVNSFGVLPMAAALTKSAHEERYYALFWKMYLPEQREIPARLLHLTGGGWTNGIPRLACTIPTVRKLLLSFALAASVMQGGSGEEKQEGMKHYVDSLKDMSDAVKGSNRTMSPLVKGVVARMFSLYEFCFGINDTSPADQASSWQSHVQGELALILSQPPEAYTAGYAHHFFADGRLHLAITAMTQRKRFVLAESQWKTIPWKSNPKTPRDRLSDTLVDLPGLFEEMDVMRACTDPDRKAALCEAVISKCWSLESDLWNWRTGADVPDPEFHPDMDKPSPTLDRVAVLHIFCLYWALQILVYNILRSVSPDPSALPERTNPRIYSRRIADAMKVITRHDSGLHGIHTSGLAAGITLMYLAQADGDVVSEESTIIQEVLRRSAPGQTAHRFLGSCQQTFSKIVYS